MGRERETKGGGGKREKTEGGRGRGRQGRQHKLITTESNASQLKNKENCTKNVPQHDRADTTARLSRLIGH